MLTAAVSEGRLLQAVDTWLLTPLVQFVGEYEALCVDQRGVLPLVQQEVSEVQGGKNAAVGRVLDEHGVQLWPSQQLPAEDLDLSVVQAAIGRPVTFLCRSRTDHRRGSLSGASPRNLSLSAIGVHVCGSHLKEAEGVLVAQLHVDHLQERPHLVVAHLIVVIFVRLTEVSMDPSGAHTHTHTVKEPSDTEPADFEQC